MPGQPQRGSGSSVLEPVVADAVAAAGFDLEQLAVTTAGRRRLVKVVVDAEEGVDLDRVAEVSRAVSAALDAHDAELGGPYTLEVTSPGLDRPLTKPRHWRRAKLRLVKVKQADGTTVTGRVGTADDDPDGGVELLVEGVLRRVAYAEVVHAVVEVEFKQPPVEELKLLEGRDSR
ncbi:MAG TPA: ribosome maturation factor RimP [Actinophytocola sp.]|uniref:ribosome maturation factor RimP n=1 Tax=Actinophytocola sp. TaxID=1872138 RepID=UPI002DDD107B|nr:ribosome maturation factor RimP [Actinophytocola sp.]HEV2782178.1 ribosome maturation factor RimP [Actinophytocola sp.]